MSKKKIYMENMLGFVGISVDRLGIRRTRIACK